MKSMRWSLIALITVLFVFFNIGHLRFEGDAHPVEIQGFVYVLGFVAVLSIVVLPVLSRLSFALSLMLWTGIYFLCKLFVFNQAGHPLLGDVHTYVSATETAFIWLLILLTYKLTKNLREFEEAVENITLTNAGGRLQRFAEAFDDIQSEIIRSRRYHHPLSVILIELDPKSIQANLHRVVREIQQAMMNRYVVTSLARVISSMMRRTDIILEQSEQGRFIVLCPETDEATSKDLAKRIQSAATDRMGVQVTCGIGSYPTGALTFDDLFRQAEGSLKDPNHAPIAEKTRVRIE